MKTASLAIIPVCEKLRPSLAAILGNTGVGAIIARALVLAIPEVSWLRALHVQADGSLVKLAGCEAQVDREKIVQGQVALLATLLTLLIAFIGKTITMQLILEVWPKLMLDHVYSGNGDRNDPNA